MLFSRIPRVAAISHVRPSREGFRPVVTIFRDGKIVRSIYGELNRTSVGAAITAEVAAQRAQHEATITRRAIITRRVASVMMPLAVIGLAFFATVQLS